MDYLIKEDTLKGIADAIRSPYNADFQERPIDAGDMPEEVAQAFEVVKSNAYAEVEPINAELEQTIYGTDTGGKSYWDLFWDTYQKNGNRTDYRKAFGSLGWTKETFKPKYDIRPKSAESMFINFNFEDVHFDLAEHLEKLGVVLDLSGAGLGYSFFQAMITHLPEISTVSAQKLTQEFYWSTVNTIDKLILKSDGSQTFDGVFIGCTNLKNLTIEGVIGKSGLDLHWSPLSRASIESVISALTPWYGGYSITLSLSAVNKAFETGEGAKDGSTSAEWLNLISGNPGWTINLA